MLAAVFRFLFSGPLDRLLSTIDGKIDSDTERERIKAETVQGYVSAQAAVLTGRGWWFPLLFLAPAGIWFSAVCIYSVLWCQRCAFPQDWTVAALPPPLDAWMGAIVGSLFIGKAGEQILAKLKR